MRKSFKAALLAACLAGVSTPASATMVDLTVDQMVDAASSIVRGTITEVWAEEDANGLIWTRAQLEVAITYKGDSSKRSFVIDQLGGKFGANISSVADSVRFSPGEDGIFFLELLGSGKTTTVGFYQGKYTVRLDPYSREMIAQRYAPAPHKAYDHRFIPLPADDKRLFLIDLEDSIRDRVQAGWDGTPIPGTSIERLQRINTKGLVK